MKLNLITKNKHKFNEIKSVAKEFNIGIMQVEEDKIEPKDKQIEEIARFNAEYYFNKLKQPVIVDDTGIFFEEYQNFPGANAKLMYYALGYKGLLKLLEGSNRNAYFMTVVGYCDRDNIKTFRGITHGIIADKVYCKKKDVLPYERIFLINNRPLCHMTRAAKNNISHRALAFRKLFEWLKIRE
ncbi:non-canonical purine NTP pyrophosphatase [Candidatus Woesearchaeota archaeon]|nr:non-canonical purine NTP pyrophosphatase [Candidatus Woesearchaeota archaeon]